MQFLINGLVAAGIYTLVAIGFSLVFATCGFFHFAHGAVYAVGAYLVYVFAVMWGLEFWLAIPLAILIAAVLGGLMEIGVYGPMRRAGASSTTLLLASLGLFIVIQNSISLIFGDATKVLRVGPIKEGFRIMDARVTRSQIAIMAVCTILTIVVASLMRFSAIGKMARAVANDPELARIVGVDVDRVVLLILISGSALASIAAILVGFDTDLTPLMGFNVLLMGVIAVIVGGVGSIGGAALGGLLLGLSQNLIAAKVSTQWQDAFAFAILIVFLLVRPQGFLGRPLERAKV